MNHARSETYVYKCLPFQSSALSENQLNHLGSQGWLLVSTLPHLVFVKRLTTGSSGAHPHAPMLLSIKQVSERLSMSRSKVYELIAIGAIASIKIGRLSRVPAEALDDFIQAHAQG